MTKVTIVALALAVSLAAGCGQKQESSSSTSTPQQPVAQKTPEPPTSFGNITKDRLLAADTEPGNWMTTGRDFGKGHYSPLTQINTDTVSRLGFAWDYDTQTNRGFEATPIEVDGVLYTSGVNGRVYALDARTGKEIWYFDPHSDGQFDRYACCDEVNRGVAVWDGMVYVGSFDGHLFGLDAKTGKVVWKVDTFIYKNRAYSSSGAPEVAGNVVVIGNAGADYDARGYVSAYDLKTGDLKWRFFIVPTDPKKPVENPELEMAAKTWDPNSRWDVGGGGTAWDSMVYDPELNLLYVGTGNAALFDWKERSPSGGDNLFLASILAINPDTGRMVWYYQEVPHESWDYTAVQPMMLTDLTIKGEKRKVLMQAPKDGFFYILDRKTGELLSADKYVPVNWASHVDLKTGRPQFTENSEYWNGPKLIYPSGMGGHSWNPMSFDPETGLVYIPSIEGASITFDATKGHVYRPMQANAGNMIYFGDSLTQDPKSFPSDIQPVVAQAQKTGEAKSRAILKAWNPLTSKVVWQHETSGWWDRAGVLSTAGGLVFQGSDNGHFFAYDAKTGKLLKDINVGTSIMTGPMSYAIGGKQYIAVMAAWGGGGWFAPHPTSAAVKYGNEGRIVAFTLNGGAVPIPPELGPEPPMPKPPVTTTASAKEVAKGAALFGRTCGFCHANQAHGLTPDLRRMTADTHKEFEDIVLKGARRFSGMPQWDDVLSEADVEAIHAYLISEAWKAYDAEQKGKTLDEGPKATQTAH